MISWTSTAGRRWVRPRNSSSNMGWCDKLISRISNQSRHFRTITKTCHTSTSTITGSSSSLNFHISRTCYPTLGHGIHYRGLSTGDNGDSKDNNITSTDDDEMDSSNKYDLHTPEEEFQIPGAQAGGKKLAIVYTCTVCDTRSIKQFSEHSYQNGVVLVRCPGCQNLHLIADRLGVFDGGDEDGSGWDIQKAMAKLGENVNVVNNDNVLEMSVEDLVGKDAIEKLTTPTVDDEDKEDNAAPPGYGNQNDNDEKK